MKYVVIVSLVVTLSACVSGQAQQSDQPTEEGTRGFHVEDLRNSKPTFLVRVDVDHANREYCEGEEMIVTVRSQKEGYLYLLYQAADSSLSCLFPNVAQTDNRIPAQKAIQVPAPGAEFRLRAGPPFGREVLKAVVTLKPVPVRQFGVKSLDEKDVTPLDGDNIKGMYFELKKKPEIWAEHDVPIRTFAKGETREVHKPRRILLAIGIRTFRDSSIPELRAADNDARTIHGILKASGQFDETHLVLNEEATFARIEQLICKVLPGESQPGDVVVIYWSGHGGRCGDEDKDEDDGYDEYLVPHDGNQKDTDTIARTMITDDIFGRWVQNLDGRKVVLIVDACHSGGQYTGEKGTDPKPELEFDFLDRELACAKDMGQKETAMLASACAKQIAYECREGQFSVMTYFLVERLKGGGSVTLENAYESVKDPVPAYVKDKFPGTTQQPVLVNHTTPPVWLKP